MIWIAVFALLFVAAVAGAIYLLNRPNDYHPGANDDGMD